jgi:hypothetical protein
MVENETNTYTATNKGKKMAQDWLNTKQATKCNRKICIGLELLGNKEER